MIELRHRISEKKILFDRWNMLRVFCLVVLFFFSTTITGCITVPVGTGLSRANPVSNGTDRKVWLSKVDILDVFVRDKNVVEESLTVSVFEYIKEGMYFKDVNLLPGKVGDEDFILHFQFDSYQQKRSLHPAYFPAAFFTLTLYIWFGGPIVNDSSYLSGILEVEDSRGSRITKVDHSVSERHGVSLWSSEYALPSGIKARTLIVKELLNKAIADIRQRRDKNNESY